MKNLKTVSALAAALLSTTVFAGGLGLGVGANVGVGAGVGGIGGLGVQGAVSQQTDAQVGSGQLGAAVRQSVGIQGDAGIDQRTVSDGAAAASARAAATARTVASQTRSNVEAASDQRVSASANVDADASGDVHKGLRHAQTASHDVILNAKQAARAQRAEARERRLQSGAAASGSVSTRASVKQAAELYTGG